MKIIKNNNLGTLDVVMQGMFTFNDHPLFRDFLSEIGEKHVMQIVLHLGQLEFVDSAALGMLLLASDEAKKHQKSITLSGATGQVKKMLEMARFNTLFTMIDAA